jgi:hypothetical protein
MNLTDWLNIQVGDKVLIKKLNSEYPLHDWIPEMDKWAGKIVEVSEAKHLDTFKFNDPNARYFTWDRRHVVKKVKLNNISRYLLTKNLK